jgi:replication-associated recombination protein RarA
MQHVRTYGAAPPPAQIRSRAIGYDDPHKHPGHLGPQEVAPDDVAGTRFYEPDDMEAPLRERLAEIRRARGRRDEGP